MAEWSNAPVLKTGMPQGIVGSNPTPSAFSQVSTTEAVRVSEGGENREMSVKVSVKPDAGRVFPIIPATFGELPPLFHNGFQIVSLQ